MLNFLSDLIGALCLFAIIYGGLWLVPLIAEVAQ